MVSGFTADGVAHLNERLSPFGLTSYAVPGGTEALDNVKLEPGVRFPVGGFSPGPGGYGHRGHRYRDLDR